MPAELPGFFWDEGRNRYFPLSSRPKKPTPQNPNDVLSKETSPAKKRHYVPWHSNQQFWHSTKFRDSHDILCYNFAKTARVKKNAIPSLGFISSLCSVDVGNCVWRFIGDDQGWVYSDKDILPEVQKDFHSFSDHLNLYPDSPISSISVSGFSCASTCRGPGKISIQNLAATERIFIWNFSQIRDIRCADFQGKAFSVGAHRKAVYFPDIELANDHEDIPTYSDVFSVVQQGHLLYAGMRNGAIKRFDLRMPKDKCQKLFDNRFGSQPRSSVLHLSIIREQDLFISQMNGFLATFDLRFSSSVASSTPIRTFPGHFNRHTDNLGIAVDPDRDLLFAAGQDCRIRGWSLRTGKSLTAIAEQSLEMKDEQSSNPFLMMFPDPVRALQVTEEYGESGVCLWASANRDLYQFRLGQRRDL